MLDAEFAEARKPAPSDGPYDQEHPERWEPGRDFEMQLPFYGFEHVDLCTAHGDQVGGHYYVWLKSQRPDADALRDRKNQLPHDYVCPQAFRTPIPEELYPTSYIAEKSCEWLDRYAGRRPRPAVLPDGVVSRPASSVHAARPVLVDVPAAGHGAAAELRSRQPAAGAAGGLGAGAARERQGRYVTEQAAFAVDEREAREAMALSCGMIAMIDDAVGRVLAQLAARGLAEDTIVIFTTDHGDFLGDHRLLLKGPAHFDGITHVPFIWAEPGTRPARTNRRARRHARHRRDRSRSRPHPALQRHPGREPAAGDRRGGCRSPRDSMVIEDDQQRAILGFRRRRACARWSPGAGA